MKVYSTLKDIQADLYAGNITCRQLVEFYLKNIEEKNNTLNAFLSVFDQEALEKADQIDAKIKAGTAKKLAGMVLGIKDLLCYKDHTSQAGSKILDGFESQFTATAVQRVIDEDAIIIGRQNCDEFGMGSTNENSAFGPCLNAVGENRVAGGSSGGSAVAVQADMCFASLGTDTGGSVRMPAGFCGLVGLKPTYTRVSRWGLIAYASSFDCIGPITKSVEDAAILLEVIAGKDEQDSTVSNEEVVAYSTFQTDKKTYKVGYLKDAVESEGLQPEVKAATLAKLDYLKAKGYQVEAVEFPLIKYFLPTYYTLTTAEASSNLSRFDGVRFGHRSAEAVDLMSLYKKSRFEGFGKEVRKRIMLGTFVLSASYYDAYYTKAQKIRRLIKEYTDNLLTEYDFLICPTTPTTAYKLGEKTADPIQMYLGDLFTVQANVVGLPAISIPNGVDNEGMPIGFQIMAGAFEEAELLAFAKEIA
ncbi:MULTISPECIES: Asp-tRNA(Asn)/Glu-tRNA(Gln) amidotransferase subunit GatA [unclassified Arcicella]|uniref:Asp-tRNA(Asn)/Glu-tRNA(Gln) amidotransferase subunit GatA n=1 Tax=unclassified Arcicella TaxID=2644986 RepID=UPI0028653A28|nr:MULTISPECIES: Asp-tRNA(Asn)/Glu-tRNA(Gln) amidotransferase subunit GatA [unclassified Arcicella]MDR6563003.1 aspartyl-tRNA(Asn)/glutamyl-tRNA(Gln) amidotransferase subunit A [Arcicella sp. BE51]MDR6813087.1 aspartyl-tRNA(Asn)/glutamyl-tRNA(Gln) amidotransferase subunit A [Arcicella sp. BE140]MDR6824401.1 aspartyl-tRNA(Asn)/glutamyl-tRNA(Gln) amidotransferase subunit A [Arcicella sp. BE139]